MPLGSLASQSHAVCDAQAAGWLTLLFLALPGFSEVFQSEPYPRPPPAGASGFPKPVALPNIRTAS
jgi:hypothetical protein